MMRALVAGFLVLLVLVGGIVLALRSGVFPGADEPADPVEVSPEAATSAEEKLGRLMRDGEEIRLNSVELTSLVRYRSESFGFDALIEPEVRMGGDTLHVGGAVATQDIPENAGLGSIRRLLPDTTSIYVVGSIRTLDGGPTILQVGRVEVAGVPVPEHYYPMILERVGQPVNESVPPGSVALPLPEPIGTARIQDGYLILSPNR